MSFGPLLSLLGGSWEAISGVIGPLIWVISIVILLSTPFRTTHEPPSWLTRRSVAHALGHESATSCSLWHLGRFPLVTLLFWVVLKFLK